MSHLCTPFNTTSNLMPCPALEPKKRKAIQHIWPLCEVYYKYCSLASYPDLPARAQTLYANYYLSTAIMHNTLLDNADIYIEYYTLCIYQHYLQYICNSCKTQTGLHGNAWLPCSPVWVLQLFCHPKYSILYGALILFTVCSG